MADYQFDNVNAGVAIKNPSISVTAWRTDFINKTCEVDILLSTGSPQANANQVVISKSGFTFTGNEPLKADIDAWVLTELIKDQV